MACPPLCVLVGGFPVLSETFVAAEARELGRLGHAVRIEAATGGDGPAHPDDPPVFTRTGDSAVSRWTALAWLALRHPGACARDLRDRRRWRREEWAPPLRELAPVARRFAR